jgi:hypothetical protein
MEHQLGRVVIDAAAAVMCVPAMTVPVESFGPFG